MHLLSFFVLQLPEGKLHVGCIVSCGVVYQLYVFKFMNASFLGVCGVYVFHSPVIIFDNFRERYDESSSFSYDLMKRKSFRASRGRGEKEIRRRLKVITVQRIVFFL